MPLAEGFAGDAYSGFGFENVGDLPVCEAGGAGAMPVDPSSHIDSECAGCLVSRRGSDFHDLQASTELHVMQVPCVITSLNPAKWDFQHNPHLHSCGGGKFEHILEP